MHGEKRPGPKGFVTLIVFLIVGVAIALSGPIALELTGGSVIKGDLASWNGQQAVVKRKRLVRPLRFEETTHFLR